MLNNPMQIFQLIGQLRNNPNPVSTMQVMFRNNPQFQQVMQMAQGKNSEQLRQTAINLCQTKGIDFQQIQAMAQGMGFNI